MDLVSGPVTTRGMLCADYYCWTRWHDVFSGCLFSSKLHSSERHMYYEL